MDLWCVIWVVGVCGSWSSAKTPPDRTAHLKQIVSRPFRYPNAKKKTIAVTEKMVPWSAEQQSWPSLKVATPLRASRVAFEGQPTSRWVRKPGPAPGWSNPWAWRRQTAATAPDAQGAAERPSLTPQPQLKPKTTSSGDGRW